MTPKLRFGFLSTANIARKNWKAIRNSGNATITAVASRHIARAKEFIALCESDAPMEMPPRAFGSYEELLASTEVDAVYIPLPTGVRKEWVIRAARAGKHVVCEKPCALSVADLEEMIAVCRENRVQFMDGVMFMHSRRLEALRAALDDALRMGRLMRITSAFSFFGDEQFYKGNIRASSELEPFGCLGDLGWYCIRLALWAMNEKLPRSVISRTLHEVRGANSPNAVPTQFSGELFFENGESSGFYSSFDCANEQWAILTGTKGIIQFPDFVLPFFGDESAFDLFNTEMEVLRCDFNMHPHRQRVAVPQVSNSHASAQETNLFKNFAAQALSGELNERWPQIALNTQKVVTACFESARRGQPVSLNG